MYFLSVTAINRLPIALRVCISFNPNQGKNYLSLICDYVPYFTVIDTLCIIHRMAWSARVEHASEILLQFPIISLGGIPATIKCLNVLFHLPLVKPWIQDNLLKGDFWDELDHIAMTTTSNLNLTQILLLT